MDGESKDLTNQFNDESKTDHPDAMTKAEYQSAFEKMAQDYFSGKIPQQKPRLFYVTGLPGAGKSSFIREAKKQRPELNDYIHINFDDLRIYHPRYEEHIKKDAVNAAARMDTAVEGLIGFLVEEAARRKLNVLLDDAAMGSEMTKIVLSPFQAIGYKIDVAVIAVPAIIARQSVHLRFEENFVAAKAGQPVVPRWVNTTEQDNAPAALVETVETIEEGAFARSLVILDRAYHVLYAVDGSALSAGMIIKSELTRELSTEESYIFQNNADRVAALMNARTKLTDASIAQKPNIKPVQ